MSLKLGQIILAWKILWSLLFFVSCIYRQNNQLYAPLLAVIYGPLMARNGIYFP